tara:strand:- start:333 stop:533 length:201 start_codon:yes stop_codon:yes gene_type:complete
MITDYLRWLRLPIAKYYKVEPVEPIAKEFPLEKYEEPESQKEKELEPEEPSEEQQTTERKRLSIWV